MNNRRKSSKWKVSSSLPSVEDLYASVQDQLHALKKEVNEYVSRNINDFEYDDTQ